MTSVMNSTKRTQNEVRGNSLYNEFNFTKK